MQTDSEADIDDVWTNLAELEALAFAPVRFLYGGITEELLLRFGLMSALVLAGWYVTGRSVRTWLRSNLHYRIPLRQYALTLVLPPAFILVSSVVYVTVFDASYAFGEVPALGMFPLALVLTVFLGGGQEELEWCGFAQPALQDGLPAFAASLLVGVVWFVWHVPLFFVPGSYQVGVPMAPYASGVLATAVVLGWLYNATGSLLVPWLYHASVNPASAYFLAGVAELQTATGYGRYALLVAAVAVVLLARYGPADRAARARVRLSDLA